MPIVSGPNHYEVLAVDPTASAAEIREAFRRLAREHHPDRAASSKATSRSMPEINEAYRVLGDPGRRAVYDASRRAPSAPPVEEAPGPTRRPAGVFEAVEPARVPWRSLLFFGTLAVIAVVVIAQFTEPVEPRGPDGIVRVGECVTIDAEGYARDATCTGIPADDLVVEALIPFGEVCPALTTAHQDRQGMGIACIASTAEFAD